MKAIRRVSAGIIATTTRRARDLDSLRFNLDLAFLLVDDPEHGRVEHHLSASGAASPFESDCDPPTNRRSCASTSRAWMLPAERMMKR